MSPMSLSLTARSNSGWPLRYTLSSLSYRCVYLTLAINTSPPVVDILYRSDAEEPFEGLQSMIDAGDGPVSQVVSNARGPFPQIGMIRPFHQARRHVSFRDVADDPRSRAVKRICKQLADVSRE